VAGSPMDEKIKWVNLSRADIAERLKKKGVIAGRHVIKKLLKKHGFVKRKMQRKKSAGQYADRDKQFVNINAKIKKYTESKKPIISIDTKKKEHLGDLHRDGQVHCTGAIEVFDHDFPHLASGTMVPHGIYDVQNNQAHINLGTSCETSDFICDSIKKWWNKYGIKAWPNTNEILILCDAGGANSYRHHVFKDSLQKLSNRLGLILTIAHYPPYASKWNPIEHRVFPHVTRSMQGKPLPTVEHAKKMIAKTSTKTGLNVTVDVIKKLYKTGKKLTDEAIQNIKIKKDKCLPDLNYSVAPL